MYDHHGGPRTVPVLRTTVHPPGTPPSIRATDHCPPSRNATLHSGNIPYFPDQFVTVVGCPAVAKMEAKLKGSLEEDESLELVQASPDLKKKAAVRCCGMVTAITAAGARDYTVGCSLVTAITAAGARDYTVGCLVVALVLSLDILCQQVPLLSSSCPHNNCPPRAPTASVDVCSHRRRRPLSSGRRPR